MGNNLYSPHKWDPRKWEENHTDAEDERKHHENEHTKDLPSWLINNVVKRNLYAALLHCVVSVS